MNRVVKAVFWAFWPILFLVVIPRLILNIIPQTDLNQLAQYTNINASSFVTGLNVLGIVLAVLSAVQSYAYKWSIAKPVSSSAHMIASFVLMLYVIGIGNPWTFGVTNIDVNVSKLSLTLNLTLTFLALMVGVAVALKIIQKTMKYREDARNHRLDLESMASPAPVVGPTPAQ